MLQRAVVPALPPDGAAMIPDPNVLSTVTFSEVPGEWVLPDYALVPTGDHRRGWRPVACRSCQALVLWVQTRRGRMAPLNADGTSHFSNCPQADRWRRKP